MKWDYGNQLWITHPELWGRSDDRLHVTQSFTSYSEAEKRFIDGDINNLSGTRRAFFLNAEYDDDFTRIMRQFVERDHEE